LQRARHANRGQTISRLPNDGQLTLLLQNGTDILPESCEILNN